MGTASLSKETGSSCPRRGLCSTAAISERQPCCYSPRACLRSVLQFRRFYPGPPAYAAVVLCVVVALRLTLVKDAFDRSGRWFVLVGGAFALYTALTLSSQLWSHAPGRAFAAFDRALVYLLLLVLLGSLGRSPQRLSLAGRPRAFAVAIVAVCGSGLITRLLPHLWPTTAQIAINRLAFPLTYWNALALIGAFGIVVCLHLASDATEPALGRVRRRCRSGPAMTLYFTFSRGGIAVAAIGAIAYALIARPRALICAIVAIVPGAGVAVTVAYRASLLAAPDSTTPAAIAQGRHVAFVVLGCVAVAALVRGILAVTLDRRLERIRLPQRARVRLRRWGGSCRRRDAHRDRGVERHDHPGGSAVHGSGCAGHLVRLPERV